MIDRDSLEYELLAQAAAQVVAAQVPGLTCEIGVRTGGGTQVILDALARSPSYAYTHLSLIHISEPTRLLSISYAVFCLKKKKTPYKDVI